MESPSVAPSAQRFYTKRDCLRGIVWNGAVLVGGVALSAFLPHLSGGAFAAPIVYLLDCTMTYFRVRRGVQIPVKIPRPPKPWEVNVLIGFVVLIAGLVVWLEATHLLPALLQPTSVFTFAAALYLHLLSVAVLLQLSRVALTEQRRSRNRSLMTLAMQATPVVAEVPVPVEKPRHWWTDTGTRDEVQQKIGRDR